jgi:hypothetical protein
MSAEDIHNALVVMTIFAGPFQIHINCGKPFLNLPHLLGAIEAAKWLGIPYYVEMNDGWYAREDLVAERFTILRQAGQPAGKGCIYHKTSTSGGIL